MPIGCGTFLVIGVIVALSSLSDWQRGWGDDTPDAATDPQGHAGSIRFGFFLSGGCLISGAIMGLLGV